MVVDVLVLTELGSIIEAVISMVTLTESDLDMTTAAISRPFNGLTAQDPLVSPASMPLTLHVQSTSTERAVPSHLEQVLASTRGVLEDQLMAAVAEYDQDDDGVLDPAELRQLLLTHNPTTTIPRQQASEVRTRR